MLSEKRDVPYNTMIGWVRCRLSFALPRVSIMAIRGARSSRNRPPKGVLLEPVEVQAVEGHLGGNYSRTSIIRHGNSLKKKKRKNGHVSSCYHGHRIFCASADAHIHCCLSIKWVDQGVVYPIRLSGIFNYPAWLRNKGVRGSTVTVFSNFIFTCWHYIHLIIKYTRLRISKWAISILNPQFNSIHVFIA